MASIENNFITTIHILITTICFYPSFSTSEVQFSLDKCWLQIILSAKSNWVYKDTMVSMLMATLRLVTKNLIYITWYLYFLKTHCQRSDIYLLILSPFNPYYKSQ